MNTQSTSQRWLWLLMHIVSSHATFAQLTVTLPVSRIVFQRNNNNTAHVPIRAACADNVTTVLAHLTPRQGGSSTEWYAFTPQNGLLSGEIPAVQGGWYDLELQAFNQGNNLGTVRIERIGVGEVLLAAGQSNAQGFPYSVGATDDRVSCVNYYDGAVTEWEFPFTFSHLDGGDTRVGPLNTSYFYGLLGDKLVQRLGVPVLIVGSAIAATSSTQWAQSAQGRTDIPDNQLWDGADDGRPYRALGATLTHYIKRVGLRAILWHQGESDKGKPASDYRNNLETLIYKTRNELDYQRLSWLIARASWIDGSGDANITTAQNQLISSVPDCYFGPNTDAFGNEYRKDGTHFLDTFYPTLAELWNQELSAVFFQQSQPFIPQSIPSITTGQPQPIRQYAGGHLNVPFMVTGPVFSNTTFTAQLVDDAGNLWANLGSGTTSPLTVFLPDNLAGNFRINVIASTPGQTSTRSERISIFKQDFGKGTGNGLMGNYMNSENPDSQPAFSRLEGPIDFIWFETPPAPGLSGRYYTIRWKGQIEPPVTGWYTFKTINDDGTRLTINNQLVIDDWNNRPWAVSKYGQIYLEANRKYDIQLDLLQGWFTAQAKLLWIIPGQNQAVFVPRDRLYYADNIPLQLTNPLYNCQTGAFEFQRIGGDYSPTSFMAIGITSWTNSPGPFLFVPAPDAQPVTLYARQENNPTVIVQYRWNWRNDCANTPLTQPRKPEVHLPAGISVGVVGQPFLYTFPANLFIDPAGLSISYSVIGLPGGLQAVGNQITGTPQFAGTYSVTIIATNTAGLSAFTQQTVTVNPAGSSPAPALQLLMPAYACLTGQFTFRSVGGDGNTIEYMAIGITSWTTNPGPHQVKPAPDAQPFTLFARLASNPAIIAQFIWDWKAACAN